MVEVAESSGKEVGDCQLPGGSCPGVQGSRGAVGRGEEVTLARQVTTKCSTTTSLREKSEPLHTCQCHNVPEIEELQITFEI